MESNLKTDFLNAIDYCKLCKSFCEKYKSYTENKYSSLALDVLGQVSYSITARSAAKACSDCDHKSTRIITILESVINTL